MGVTMPVTGGGCEALNDRKFRSPLKKPIEYYLWVGSARNRPTLSLPLPLPGAGDNLRFCIQYARLIPENHQQTSLFVDD